MDLLRNFFMKTTFTGALDPQIENLAQRVIGAAIEVHKELGPGLLESAYKQALSHELELQKIPHRCEAICPIIYKGKTIEQGYRIDILVDERIILELKAVEKLIPKHKAQLLTHMKFRECKLGFLLNFNEVTLAKGLERVIRTDF